MAGLLDPPSLRIHPPFAEALRGEHYGLLCNVDHFKFCRNLFAERKICVRTFFISASHPLHCTVLRRCRYDEFFGFFAFRQTKPLTRRRLRLLDNEAFLILFFGQAKFVFEAADFLFNPLWDLTFFACAKSTQKPPSRKDAPASLLP